MQKFQSTTIRLALLALVTFAGVSSSQAAKRPAASTPPPPVVVTFNK
ncbi:hypothetical protein HQ447_15650, partial [bacterium]|nr:hypothetical protein [bacterium]